MMFPWEETAIIANLLASLSIFSGVAVYKLEKSDTEIYDVQRAIIKLRTNVQSLNHDFRTELFSEMASATIYSKSLQSTYSKLLLALNEKIRVYQNLPRKKQDSFVKSSKDELLRIIGVIPTSVSTPLVIRTEEIGRASCRERV